MTMDYNPIDDFSSPERDVPESDPQPEQPAVAQFNSASTLITKDTRVKLEIPDSYALTDIGKLLPINGILFPYTPSINQEYTASYSAINTIHSNYTQYFYKNSAVGQLTVTGKFTVQNPREAEIYLSTIHVLRALTKMKFGDDSNAGSPPPVCRFFGYGDYMFDNVPVSVASFRIELSDTVDFYTLPDHPKFGTSTVPVWSSIQLTLNPMYSRQEMLNGTVSGWMTGDQRKGGYL